MLFNLFVGFIGLSYIDLLQDPDLRHLLAQSVLVKVPKGAVLVRAGVQAEAGVVAGARVYHGDKSGAS
ncbi:hypothetical protein L6452_43348 [Arctium lappa]|uniref:Uncharacterized protein n=1 Tax=Arctium lappa TaxID=4217 RepID=A0ACB8XLX4_ARCLA|nr:hypothetical protein L6452_43348 [Arctium lappa]